MFFKSLFCLISSMASISIHCDFINLKHPAMNCPIFNKDNLFEHTYCKCICRCIHRADLISGHLIRKFTVISCSWTI